MRQLSMQRVDDCDHSEAFCEVEATADARRTNGNTAPPAAPTAKVNVEVFYVHPDHLGTPRVITASTALAATTGTGITSPQTVNKAVWRWDSDPFGSNATANSAPNENPNTLSQVVGTATLPYLFGFDLAFPGQKRDRETGKHYNYFRDYDPAIGRYFESDPIGLKGGLSTFGYVENGPVAFTDPRGLHKQDKWWGRNDREFHRWFHLCWKEKGNPDADQDEIEEAYAEWLKRGSPRGGRCDGPPPPPPAPVFPPEKPRDLCGPQCVKGLKAVKDALTGATIFIFVCLFATT